jgi:hypothetical protein
MGIGGIAPPKWLEYPQSAFGVTLFS